MKNVCDDSSGKETTAFPNEFLEQMYPAFVIEEETYRLVSVNDMIRRELGEVEGRTCHETFWGSAEPCKFCPKPLQNGQNYSWECFDRLHNRVYNICNRWQSVNGRTYRLSMAVDTSEMMKLNCSVVDYLLLMQQLSTLQAQIIDQKSHTLEIVLTFLQTYYGADAAIAARSGGEKTVQLLCRDGQCRALPVGELPTEAGDAVPVLDEQYTFWLRFARRRKEWEESRGIVLDIVKLYLENDLLRERVEWENEHDKITRCFNRTAFRQHAQTVYPKAQELSVAFFDIDNLKQTNDACGHDMGDCLIRKAADALLSVADERVWPYRMGGDEFLLVCLCGEKELQEILRKVSDGLRQSNETTLVPQISISCGWAYSKAPFDLEKLICLADERMYADKREKKV